MIIKVCGMREPQNIREVAALAINWIGFIFYERSKRFVERCPTEQQATDSEQLSPKKVGVFVNATIESMMEKASTYKLDYLQLHGNESPEDCHTLQKRGYLLIKAFPIATKEDFEKTREYEGRVDYFLFDTRCEGYGGSGKRFDWSILTGYKGETPFLLSGGIRPENAEAIRNFRHPRFAGIDLNSGFEIEPGLKDIDKLKNFIQQILHLTVMNRITNLFQTQKDGMSFLIFFIISRIGYAACNIFYDAMLIDITTDERMDRVSTCGYAFGYIGSCIPFVAGLLLILNCDTIGLPMVTATRISFVITMVWWIIMSIPLYKNVHQQYSLPHEPHVFAATFKRLGATFQKLAKDKRMLFFIIGYFCYIDGVYTIISMATTYGGEVGIDSNAMVLALLLTQFVAFPCSILSGTLAKKFGSMRMIKIFIVMYMAICLFGYGLDTELEFWILAVSVGICQGGIQALSRSYYGKIIPKDESSEYFGFFDVFGKFADFFGPLIISFCAYFFHNSKYGVLSLILLFAVGLILITLSEKQPTAAE